MGGTAVRPGHTKLSRCTIAVEEIVSFPCKLEAVEQQKHTLFLLLLCCFCEASSETPSGLRFAPAVALSPPPPPPPAGPPPSAPKAAVEEEEEEEVSPGLFLIAGEWKCCW